MKYRIDERFSIDAESGFPCLDYMVQRRVWLRWEDVELHTTEEAAQRKIDEIERVDG
jgi:hypothetical protein